MTDYGTTTYYTTSNSGSLAALGIFSGVWLIFWLVFLVLVIAAFWKIFTKAKQPGWAAIIPFYNIYILLKTVGRPGWWLILYLIPIVNLVITIIVALDLAKSFGKDAAFGVFLNWLLAPIGQLIIGFGSAKYKGPSAR